MTIPLAVSPSILTPGIYITVDLTAGAASPGTGLLSTLLMAPKASTGDLQNDVEIRAGAGPASASTAFGKGSIGHLMAKLLYAEDPTAQIDFVSPAPGSTAAALNITASGTAGATGNVVEFNIAGRVVEVAWLAGETGDQLKTRAISSLNAAFQGELPTVASSGGSGIITNTFRVTGTLGNDCKLRARLLNTVGGTEAIDTNAFTALSGGATASDFTNALANAAGKEYHFIVPALANAEVQLGTGSNNPTRIKTHINTYNSGLNAKLQQCVTGSTGTITNAKVGSIARNTGPVEQIEAENILSLPGELAARECGGRLAAVKIDPAANRIGEILDGLFGSPTPVTDAPTASEAEDALGNGLSLCGYTASGELYLIRAVTTYCQDAAGGADRRLLDTQNVDASYIVIRDLRTSIPQEFQGAKIAKDSLPGEDPPPEGVTEERDIKAFVVGRLLFWADRGVVQRQPLLDAISDGSLIVQVNSSDATQVDIVIPFKVVQPLAKVGVVGQRLAG